MALKKSQLYSSLWSSADELRGSMDASQYKDYVLTLLFVKYVSDKYAGKSDALIEVPEGGSFKDLVKLKGDKEIGDKINTIIRHLADANDLKGVIDIADFNDPEKLGTGPEMVDRLSRLVAIFDELDFSANRAGGDDLLGDAYEYLMRHFATQSGKSKGQFYTPGEVSRVMAHVIGIGPDTVPSNTIYDPTCGSGSLLLKAADQAPRGISIYGQENDLATWALARMNMILHGHPTAEIWKGNTLAAPHFKEQDGGLRRFDFAVANPPFSLKAWSTGVDPDHDQYGRFVGFGIPPVKNGDYAFLLHLVKSLGSKGRGAIILPHGVLFRGNKEADIRRNLVKRGLIEGIIGLPPNLFYGTSIPACIVVIDKAGAGERESVFVVDASKGFIKDGNKNRLRAQDIHKVVDVFTKRLELPRYSRSVSNDEIESNGYNLNIPRYVDASEPEDLQDLDAHLRGGIPNRDIEALAAYWEVFPSLRGQLFRDGDRAGYSEAVIEPSLVKKTILDSDEFTSFSAGVSATFTDWTEAHRPMLRSFTEGAPTAVIAALSEDLLERFRPLPLVDEYDVYQRLLDYWDDVMQDDLYLITADGWLGAAQPRAVIDNTDRKIKETPDLTIGKKKYKLDLVPPRLIVDRFFQKERAELEELEVTAALVTAQLEEFIEENSGEEGALEGARNDKGTIPKKGIADLLKDLPEDESTDDDRRILTRCVALFDAEAAARKTAKDARGALDAQTLARYETLTEDEVKALVVDDKWFATLWEAVEGEAQKLLQTLVRRVEVLERRYARTLPQLEHDAVLLRAKVNEHLAVMGFART